MAKYCANCGRELPDEAMYCPECGHEYVERYKADHYSGSDSSNSGSSGSSKDEFKGPFDDFDNRSSTNPFESSSKKASENSSDGSAETSSNGPNNPNAPERLPWGKICIVLFILMFLFTVICYYADTGTGSNSYDTSLIEESSNNLSSHDYLYDRNRNGGYGNLDSNEPYNMSIDKNAYLSGKGEARLIDSNHSYNIESEGFNITEYETYYVDLEDEGWYVLDIFKCKFDTPAKSQVYSTDMDDGDPIIIYCAKDDYYGYGIIMPSSSDDSKYKNMGFLESIFHYKKE